MITFACADGTKAKKLAWYFKEYYPKIHFAYAGVDPFLAEVEGNLLLDEDLINRSSSIIFVGDVAYHAASSEARSKAAVVLTTDVSPEGLMNAKRRVNL